MKIPSHFPKWNKATDGLQDAGIWALDIERSRLPRDTILPRAGQIWEAIRDCEVHFEASIPHPKVPKATGFPRVVWHPAEIESYMRRFGTVRLLCGEKVRIVDAEPLVVIFIPLRYDGLHERIVPVEIRMTPGYSGYTLSVKTAKTISDLCMVDRRCQTFFKEDFRLVEDAPSGDQ